MFLVKESVFERKKQTTGMWLLGSSIEFSCLYIPQGHYFKSTDNFVIFWFWAEVHL